MSKLRTILCVIFILIGLCLIAGAVSGYEQDICSLSDMGLLTTCGFLSLIIAIFIERYK
jgi:hypothetical protein